MLRIDAILSLLHSRMWYTFSLKEYQEVPFLAESCYMVHKYNKT